MKWLITGGCGFIGRNLVNELKRQGEFVRIVDNLTTGIIDGLQNVEFIFSDIEDADIALQTTKGIDVIVHLAGNTGVEQSVEFPQKDCVANVIGTLNYLEAARQNSVKRFIFASSGAVCGEVDPPMTEDLPLHPVSPYGASKAACEGYCSAYYKTFGLETVCLRFGNVYGRYSEYKNSVVAQFIKQATSGEEIAVYGDGSQTRDFIHVIDIAIAICLAATAPGIGGEVFQIATGREHTIIDLIDILKTELGDISYRLKPFRRGDVKRNYADAAKAYHLLGWESNLGLREGLRDTVKYYLEKEQCQQN